MISDFFLLKQSRIKFNRMNFLKDTIIDYLNLKIFRGWETMKLIFGKFKYCYHISFII